MRILTHIIGLSALVTCLPVLNAQTTSSSANLPRVVIPTYTPQTQAPTSRSTSTGRLYPWKKDITATVFWIGEKPTQNNPVPNDKSSWDQSWTENYGGYDNPDPAARVADHARSDFRPKHFIPKLNPFYIALPYNDVKTYRSHKPEAAKVIPWYSREKPKPGKTCLKGRWIQIYHNGQSCYAQWEDCGPWVTDDWQYVFGNNPPKNKSNKSAAIDISPAVRDYLDLQSGEKCHWRFVENAQVPHGPWKKYGTMNATADRQADADAKRRYLEYLRKLRDEQYRQNGSSNGYRN